MAVIWIPNPLYIIEVRLQHDEINIMYSGISTFYYGESRDLHFYWAPGSVSGHDNLSGTNAKRPHDIETSTWLDLQCKNYNLVE